MQILILNENQNHLLENDFKSKSQFKNLISNRNFKSFDFKLYPTIPFMIVFGQIRPLRHPASKSNKPKYLQGL